MAKARVSIRAAQTADTPALVEMRCELWPADAAEHAAELRDFFAGSTSRTEVLLVAEHERQLVGFAEISLRSYADGCASSPVGYLEGWFVRSAFREQGVGKQLVAAAEVWARAQGCSEFASDADVNNTVSAAAHAGLGFDEVGVVRQYRKSL